MKCNQETRILRDVVVLSCAVAIIAILVSCTAPTSPSPTPDGVVVSTLAGTAGSNGSTDATGSAARFRYPGGITTDGSSLFLADTNNSTIRKIVIATGEVTTLAGTAGLTGSSDGTGSAARFYAPYGLDTDGTNLYVADTGNNTIRQVVIATGVVTTLAGTAGVTGDSDGTGAAAEFDWPYDVATDGTNVFVGDRRNYSIRQVVIATGVVTTVAGNGSQGGVDGTGTAASFHTPRSLATDGTNLYIADSGSHTIRQMVIATKVVTTLAGTQSTMGSEDGTGSEALFKYPEAIATDGTNLYIADSGNHTIRKMVIATAEVTTLAGLAGSSGSSDGIGSLARFNYPMGMATNGTTIFVSDTNNHTVRTATE